MVRLTDIGKTALKLTALAVCLSVLLLGLAAHAQQSGDAQANPFLAWAAKRQEYKQQGYAYVGNVKSYKFHKIDCRWAKRCTKNCQAPFNTREQAAEAGFIPCKVCKP